MIHSALENSEECIERPANWIDNFIHFCWTVVPASYSIILFTDKLLVGRILILASLINLESGIVGFLAVILANLSAMAIGLDKNKLNAGCYGFNALLIVLGILYFFKITSAMIALILVVTPVSVLITEVLDKLIYRVFGLSSLSIPFVLVTLGILLAATQWTQLPLKYHSGESIEQIWSIWGLTQSYLKSLSGIFFSSDWRTGFLIFVAILVYSRIAAFITVFAFLFSFGFMQMLGLGVIDFARFFSGYNFILCALAVFGVYFIPGPATFLASLFSVMTSVIVYSAFKMLLIPYNLPVLTLPFNIVTLIFVYGLRSVVLKNRIIPVYRVYSSPEEALGSYVSQKSFLQEGNSIRWMFLPFYGEWQVSQGFSGKETHHSGYEYSLDFTIFDNEGNRSNPCPANKLEHFYVWKIPVVAPADGTVSVICNNIEDSPPYEANPEDNWGNTVVLYHAPGVFSKISHLSEKSIILKEGQKVYAGQSIGTCGNSGRSIEPHVHFQIQCVSDIPAHSIPYVFRYFLRKTDSIIEYCPYSIPEKGDVIQHIAPHSALKNLFHLQIGRKYQWKVNQKEQEIFEEFEVSINFNGEVYLKSIHDEFHFFYDSVNCEYVPWYYEGRSDSILFILYAILSGLPLVMESEMKWKYSLNPRHFLNNFEKWVYDISLPFISLYEVRCEGEFLPVSRLPVGDNHIRLFNTSVKMELLRNNEVIRTWLARMAFDESGNIINISLKHPNEFLTQGFNPALYLE